MGCFTAKEQLHEYPNHYGAAEIPLPPAKKSCLDGAAPRRYTQANEGRLCIRESRITTTTSVSSAMDETAQPNGTFLCDAPLLGSGRHQCRHGKEMIRGSVQVLLSNPRSEKWFLKFLEISGAGRVLEDGVDEEEAWGDSTGRCCGNRRNWL
jgi:hypothetical protein